MVCVAACSEDEPAATGTQATASSASSSGTGATGATGGTGGAGASGASGGEAGGGAGGSGGGEAPAEWVAYCESYGATYCAGIFQCYGPYAAAFAETEPQCAENRSAACVHAYDPDNYDIADGEACTAALEVLACDDYLGFLGSGGVGFPEVCQFSGKLPDGAPCGLPFECQGGMCSGHQGSDKLCGVCGTLPAVGDACVDGECDWGLTCASNECVVVGAVVGDACGAEQPCRFGLRCDAGACADLLPDGAPCDGQFQCGIDSACNFQTLVCEPLNAPSVVGGSCGYQLDGSSTLCAQGWCQFNPATGTSTCIAEVGAGETCQTGGNLEFTGSNCQLFLACFDGICQYPGDFLTCE